MTKTANDTPRVNKRRKCAKSKEKDPRTRTRTCYKSKCCSFWKFEKTFFNTTFHPSVGVAYDTYQKKLSSTTQKSGLHNGAPGFKFIKFPSVFKTLEFDEEKCLNKEGVEIELQIEFQYRARPQKLRDIIMEFRDHDNYIKMLK